MIRLRFHLGIMIVVCCFTFAKAMETSRWPHNAELQKAISHQPEAEAGPDLHLQRGLNDDGSEDIKDKDTKWFCQKYWSWYSDIYDKRGSFGQFFMIFIIGIPFLATWLLIALGELAIRDKGYQWSVPLLAVITSGIGLGVALNNPIPGEEDKFMEILPKISLGLGIVGIMFLCAYLLWKTGKFKKPSHGVIHTLMSTVFFSGIPLSMFLANEYEFPTIGTRIGELESVPLCIGIVGLICGIIYLLAIYGLIAKACRACLPIADGKVV